MNNDNNFEQQFAQNVKASLVQPTPESQPLKKQTEAKTPLIIAVVLAVALVIETVALTIMLSNYFSMVNPGYEDEYADDIEWVSDDAYVFDAEDNLIAMGLTCTLDDGASYILTTDGKYQQFNNANSMTSFGTYNIINDSLIVLNDSSSVSRVLYYDGFDLADGITIYGCVENVPRSTSSNAN